MGIEKKAFLICDRCGGKVEIDYACAVFDVASRHPGWTRVGNRDLCPECSPLYEAMVARHRVEANDHLNNRV